MKRWLLALLLLPSLTWAAGPQFGHVDANTNQEFQNVYNDIRSPRIGIGQASTMTVSYINVASITINGANFTAATAAALLQYTGPTFTATQTISTSNTYADATGLSISITPTLSTSHVLIAAIVCGHLTAAANQLPVIDLIITDSADSTIREYLDAFGLDFAVTQTLNVCVYLKAWDAPGSTAAKTYKVRLRRNTNTAGGSVRVNNSGLGQVSMIEATEYR